MPGANEAGLLRLLLRLEPRPIEVGRARSLAAALPDPGRFLLLARQARVAPLLHWHGRNLALAWPDAISGALRAEYARSVSRAAAQDATERRVGDALSSAGVRWILLKGAALRRTVYPDAALRPMHDIDLWVHPEDLDGADAALRLAGVRRAFPDAAWPAIRGIGQEAGYVDPTTEVPVELHPGLRQYERYRGVLEVPPDRIWDESRPAPESTGLPPARLPPAWLEGPYLAFHAGAVHGFQGTLWMLDLYEWTRLHAPSLDWNALLDEGRRYGMLAALGWAARILQPTHPLPLPAHAARHLSRAISSVAWARRLLPPLFCGDGEYAVPHGAGRVRPLLALPDWPARIRAVARGLLPSATLREARIMGS